MFQRCVNCLLCSLNGWGAVIKSIRLENFAINYQGHGLKTGLDWAKIATFDTMIGKQENSYDSLIKSRQQNLIDIRSSVRRFTFYLIGL